MKPLDELAERRAAKGIVTIKIAAGDASVVQHAQLPLQATIDQLATLKARRPRKNT